MRRFASPLGGKTIDRRAGCGRPASPVRREGETTSLPTPITTFLLAHLQHRFLSALKRSSASDQAFG